MKQFRLMSALMLVVAILMPAYAQRALPADGYDVLDDLPGKLSWRIIHRLDPENAATLVLSLLAVPQDRFGPNAQGKAPAGFEPFDPAAFNYVP